MDKEIFEDPASDSYKETEQNHEQKFNHPNSLEDTFAGSHDALAHKIFQSLESEKDNILGEHYSEMREFRGRLFETWKNPLKRLDSLLYICTEIVSEVRNASDNSPISKTHKYNIATRLHARCVQVGNEISHLLHGGFADGAFARWRTLHETSVTTKFICEGDEDLATRFTDYQNVTRLKIAKHYNEHNELKFESLTADQLKCFEEERKRTIDKYEDYFIKSFGWATKALGKPVTSKIETRFFEIEKFVGLSYLKNHFNFASQYVHAGTDSIGYKLGTSMSGRDILLTGPSNEGLFEPIQCSSLSLCHATIALLEAFPDDELLVKTEVIRMWHEKIKEEAHAASSALQEKGDRLQQKKNV